MTRTKRVASLVLGSSLIAASCMGGWLHRAYNGELVDEHMSTKTKFVVSTNGTIDIQEWGYPSSLYYIGTQTPPQDWQQRWEISNIDDLRMAIKDLQKVEADMTAADCDSPCEPKKPCDR